MKTIFIAFILVLVQFLVKSPTNAQSCTCEVIGGPNRSLSVQVDDDNCSHFNQIPVCGNFDPLRDTGNPPCTCIAPLPGTNCGTVGQYAIGGKCCDPGAYIESRGGICTASPTPSPAPILKICSGISDAEQKTQCQACLGENDQGPTNTNNPGMWTALGCIKTDPKDFIADFLKLAMGVAGGIALLLMVYGSFLISTSAGDPKKAEEGKEIITGTIAGLLFIIFSVVLLRVIGVDILNIPGL